MSWIVRVKKCGVALSFQTNWRWGASSWQWRKPAQKVQSVLFVANTQSPLQEGQLGWHSSVHGPAFCRRRCLWNIRLHWEEQRLALRSHYWHIERERASTFDDSIPQRIGWWKRYFPKRHEIRWIFSNKLVYSAIERAHGENQWLSAALCALYQAKRL